MDRIRNLRSMALGIALFATSAVPAQPTIDITAKPTFGSPGTIAGRVTGVNTATHRVAVYIQIEGGGWWTKPSFSTPTVPIQPDGTFTANVYGGGLDAFATIYCAALVGSGITPPRAQGGGRIPATLNALAIDFAERYGRTIEFAGRRWAVKEAATGVGPGGNRFGSTQQDVWVDGLGRLHLTVRYSGGSWRSSEVMSVEHFGFGTYWFTTESELEDLDANLTFGAFTWDPYGDDPSIPSWPAREIDFEDSRWGQPSSSTTSQVVVQPWDVPGNLQRFTLPDLAGNPTLTRFFTWRADRVEFTAARGRHSPFSVPAPAVLHHSTYLHDPGLGHLVPTEGRARFHFNLWINTGGAPRNGQTAEVVISNFRFDDQPGTFVGGCGINPARSMTVLGGSAGVGRRLFLGIDNPAGTQPAGSSAALFVSFSADPAFPCGTPFPGLGMLGPTGEIQVDPAGLVTLASGIYWNGPGVPVLVQLAFPSNAALIGHKVYAQGLLVDTSPGSLRPFGLTDAIEIVIQPCEYGAGGNGDHFAFTRVIALSPGTVSRGVEQPDPGAIQHDERRSASSIGEAW